ncbi:MAG: hypothetical protein ACREQ5_34255, partial [Candidatus Dormibacteria bacterium]
MPLIFTQLASDNFTRANENPLSDGGKWLASNAAEMPQIVSNVATPVTGNTDDIALFDGGVNFTADQW